MRWWLALGILIGALFPISAMPCEFHPVPSFDKGLVQVEPFGTSGLVQVEPFGTSGLVGFYYDVDGDDVPDRALLFQRTPDGQFVRWPIFYVEGLDRDGLADETWVDTGGEGLCADMRLYHKRRL